MSLFGTDGIRGVANKDLTPDLAVRLGRAAGTWLRNSGGGGAVIGRDTRKSGPMLGAALAAGFNSAGVDVTTLGVSPTPGVSFAVRTSDTFHLGAVVSASHNPAEDNGIKFLGHDGRKLTDTAETEIEALIDNLPSIAGDQVGALSQEPQLLSAYEFWLSDQLPERLDGLRIAVDCANGAASAIAPRLLRNLGAEVVSMFDQPDGTNINHECGATNPGMIQQLTVESNAALGIAFDGDADRCVFSDEGGKLINGDRLMGIWSAFWKNWDKLEPPIIVGTVMSNMGFERALEGLGITLERTGVGDRYVAERMAETGAKVGGEQSGHIIFSDLTPTGDGLLTALQLLRVLRKSGCAASELPPVFENWPQLLVNVRVPDRKVWQEAVEIHNLVAMRSGEFGERGRIVVRPSGTQPMIRVMVEAEDSVQRDTVADEIVSRVQRDLGGQVQGRVDLTHALGD
ncbi:MAG: phosphoglucosamine mutase [Fimbriimonadales bacterium]